MRTYTGMVELRYINSRGYPVSRFVIAFHSTAKELKEDFLPGVEPGQARIIKYKGDLLPH